MAICNSYFDMTRGYHDPSTVSFHSEGSSAEAKLGTSNLVVSLFFFMLILFEGRHAQHRKIAVASKIF